MDGNGLNTIVDIIPKRMSEPFLDISILSALYLNSLNFPQGFHARSLSHLPKSLVKLINVNERTTRHVDYVVQAELIGS
jgi:hypothetical protein